MNTICLATGNMNKLKEIMQLFSDLPARWKSLADFPELPVVVEDGHTFEANAFKKAQTIYRETGLLTVADDSGLEVDALNGAPGVYSARFAGEDSNDIKNNEKLRQLLSDVPFEKRTARFRCVAAMVGDQIRYAADGKIEGHIILIPRGTSGFGYDPIFIPDGFNQTFAELGDAVKNEISHRAKAFKSLKQVLMQYLSD